MPTEDFVMKHTRQIAETTSLANNNKIRLDNIDKLVEVVNGMNINVSIIAEQIKQQGSQLKELINTLKTHEEKIETIEEKMETKDTVARLHERIDILETSRGKEAEKQLTQMKWIVFILLLTSVVQFYLSKIGM